MTAQLDERREADSLPDPIWDALARLCSTEVDPSRVAMGDDAWVELSLPDAARHRVHDELEVVEAAERLKAWADSRALAALRRLYDATEVVVESNAEYTAIYLAGEVDYGEIAVETMTASVDEVGLATGLPTGAVSARMHLALDEGRRCTPMFEALAEGRVSLERAIRTHAAVQGLDPEVARAVCARLLTPGRDGAARSHRWFTRELKRQVAVHTPDPAEARAEALQRRSAFGWLEDDGTGTLRVTGDGARITAALDRLDDLARSLRQAGDARTLDQLRSDLALDLLLYGWADPTTLPADAPEACRATFVGQPPVAHATVVVPLTTLLTLDDEPCELVGHGFVSAAYARQVAYAGGSTWRRLVVDPVDGTALELSITRYRPTREMAEQVAAMDGVCQAPGCAVPAARCDLDHERPWPSGETTTANLRSRHRRHHNHKTRGTWTTHDNDDGTTTWRTVGGREYLSYRHPYLDPLSRPVTPAEVEAVDLDEPPPF